MSVKIEISLFNNECLKVIDFAQTTKTLENDYGNLGNNSENIN